MKSTINHLNGMAFEERVLNHLSTIFECVEWTSRKFPSAPYDFVCTKDNKVFYGDAKLKPEINISKLKALDFIIVPDEESFKIIENKDFDKIFVNKSTTIKIMKDVLNRLHALGIYPEESPNSIINRLIEEHNTPKI